MQLPALPSSYPLFDWTISNGSATAEQTQAAYTAITSQGACSDFSRFVWNDLVDTLSNALEAAGLAWNESYGTAESAKITSYLEEFTARKFNNVRHNIQNLINATWPWEYNPTVKGYLGRVNMRGVSTYGENADIVYGWYIEELARMINITIQVLRNDEILSRMAHIGESQTIPKADLFPAVAGFMAHDRSIQSINGADLFPAVAGFMNAGTSFYSGESAAPVIYPPSFLKVREKSRTTEAGRIFKAEPAQLSHEWDIRTSYHANLSDMMYIGWLRHTRNIQTSYQAKLVFSNSHYVSAAITSLTAAASALDRAAPLHFGAAITGSTDHSAALEYYESKLLLHSSISRSSYRVDDLLMFPPVFTRSTQRSQSAYQADAALHLPRMLQSFGRSDSEYAAAADIYPPGQLESRQRSKTFFAATLPACPTGVMEAHESSRSASESAVIAVPPVNVEAAYAGHSAEVAEMLAGQPEFITAEETSRSAQLVLLDSVSPERLTVENSSVTATGAQLNRTPKRNLKISKIIRTAVHAVLSFYQAQLEETWFDPVRNGSDLYIRSIWKFWRDGDRGYIDVDIWYEPVRSGSDLYIRSVWNSYQDRDMLFVDTAVWYETIREGSNLRIRSSHSSYRDGDQLFIDLSLWLDPVQEGSNLYLRSLDSFWVDGNQGNVDTPVYLPPVQNGSDLYIRQNLFGGD